MYLRSSRPQASDAEFQSALQKQLMSNMFSSATFILLICTDAI